MKISYHQHDMSDEVWALIERAIQNSQESLGVLAARYGIGCQVAKTG